MSEYAKREAINRLQTDVAALKTYPTMADVTATADALNAVSGTPVTLTTSATPATGSNAAQFVFKDADGVTVDFVFSGLCYLTKDVAGATVAAADTGVAVLTNGVLTEIVTKSTYRFITDGTGKLGVTLTSAADTYYMAFVMPNGKVVTSSALVVN
jgi:hypothetical protein